MGYDLSTAASFMAGHARVLDRRRFELMEGGGDVAGVLAALDAYRNPDGGYGWGLEPDLRSPESQPGAALHAFEVLAEIAPRTSPRAAELCGWLESVTRDDGGLPFALPLGVPAATAPWWSGADPSVSSLQITSVSAAMAHQVARHDPAVAAHPWLRRATDYCLTAIGALREPPGAYVLAFAVRFLDSVYGSRPEAAGLLTRLAAFVPPDGRVPVAGGTEGEALRPLDFAPYPDSRARELFAPEVIEADLDRLAGGQREDGGWAVDYVRVSPAGALDWRGSITVWALHVLRRNGR
ncbi:hypothetical protein ACQEUU_26090 [Nonomuraea sp. CA-218870]|uniref:hypothetical protein n=1 Tax=Nonomuraea sp. CA-218870 TaxID=3239998 RepID=UPI003D8E63BC